MSELTAFNEFMDSIGWVPFMVASVVMVITRAVQIWQEESEKDRQRNERR